MKDVIEKFAQWLEKDRDWPLIMLILAIIIALLGFIISIFQPSLIQRF